MLLQKGCILMYPLDNETAGYTWDKQFVLPYESLWGIIEKFRYFNALKTLKSKKLPFKVSYFSNLYDNEDGYIYYYNVSYDTKDICNFLKINYLHHFKPLEKLAGNNLSFLFEKKVQICPKCIRYGYHSYFHQLCFRDGYCFIHSNEKLVQTEIPYYISYSEDGYFFDNDIIHKYLLPSQDIIYNLLVEKNFKFPDIVHWGDNICNLKIYNFNPTNFIFTKISLQHLCHDINNLFKEEKIVYGTEIYSIDKETAQKKWESYHFNESLYDIPYEMYHNWFADYCYFYSKKLYAICEEQKIEDTLRNFRGSFLAEYHRNLHFDYDAGCISTILTAAKITGFSKYPDMTEVFSSRWNFRNNYRFLETEFSQCIKRCTENYEKTIMLELYKWIIKDVHDIIQKNAYAGYFSKKTYLQISLEIELPIYIVIEEREFF